MGLFRPSVEFAVRVVGELARAEGEYFYLTVIICNSEHNQHFDIYAKLIGFENVLRTP